MGIEIMPAALTDRYGVAIRITVQDTDLQRARGRWKMDPVLINDKHLIKRISSEWVKWQTHKRHYPDITMWWERCVKKRLPILICKEQYERYKYYKIMENHLYQCIYDILLSDIPEPAKLPALQRYKAKIVRLHSRRMEKVMLNKNVQDKLDDEEPSFSHILKMVKRCETRVILQVLDMLGNDVSGHRNVLNTFATHLRQKYEPIVIDQTCVTRLQGVILRSCSTKYADLLEQPITIVELSSALR